MTVAPMDDDIRLRSACDRCHSQKLRCPKRQGAGICDRCSKFGASCVYSPFRQKKDAPAEGSAAEAQIGLSKQRLRNKKELSSDSKEKNAHKRKRVVEPTEPINIEHEHCVSSSTAADNERIIDPLGADWSSNSFDALHDMMADPCLVNMDLELHGSFPQLDFNLSPFPNHIHKMDNLLQLSSPPSPHFGRSIHDTLSGRFSPPAFASSTSGMALALPIRQLPIWNGIPRNSHQLSFAHCIRQLSGLSIGLVEHSNTIPPQSIHDLVPENELYQDTMNERARDYSSYGIDDTFRLTQELIDVYPSSIYLFTRRRVCHSSQSSNIQHSFIYPDAGEDQGVERLGPGGTPILSPLNLDHSSILLLLSCHLRVIDIYEELFKHMQVCIDLKGAVCTAAQASFASPQLKIGNYTPPMTAAVQMQMLLLLHFATSLCDYAIELDSHIQKSVQEYATSESLSSGHSEDEVRKLSLLSARKVSERATAMLQRLSSMRSLVL